VSRSFYLAYITILSELVSVVQSILSLTGLPLNYLSMFAFMFLVLPALTRLPMTALAIILAVLSLQVLKSFFIGLGPEFAKSSVLLIFAGILILMSQQMFVEDFINVLTRWRWYIVGLGLLYVILWYHFGTYRNASTFSLALMTFLGFQRWMRFSSLVFLLNAKTLYQIAALNLFFSLFTRSMISRTLFLSCCVIFAALAPILLVIALPPDVIIFTSSHTASLGERILETKTFLDNINSKWSVFLWGDQLGWVLESSDIKARGYVHANHLWLIRTLGLPIWLFGAFLMIKNVLHGGWPVLGSRSLIFVSTAFVMTLFTSPFLTMFLLCRVRSDR